MPERPLPKKHPIRQSLNFKVAALTTLIMVVVLAVFSAVFVVSELQKTEENILQNGKTFTNFATQSIYSNYLQFYTHPLPEDFQNFKTRVQAILAFNQDITDVSLMGLSGRILFESKEFNEGKHSGAVRTTSDKDTIQLLRKDEVSTRQLTINGLNYTEIVVPLEEASGGHIISARYVLSYTSLAARMLDVYQRVAIVDGILLVFVVAIAVALSRRLTSPIVHLTSVAQQIQGGNFDVRAKVLSQDELGTLAIALNNMASDLKGSYENLEAKVSERTSELEATQVKLQESVNTHDALLASIADGVIATDKDGNIVLINKVAQDLLRVDNDANGKPYTRIWNIQTTPGEKITQAEDPMYIALSAGASTHSSKYFYSRKPDDNGPGLTFPIAVSVSAVKINDETIGAIAVVRDITREKEVDRMKTEFISLASHQLRTPLSAIKWFTEMLMDGDAGKLTPEQLQFVRNVSESTERMLELVRALLNISRIESGRIIIDPKPTNIAELVGGIVKDVEAKVTERKQQLTVDVDKTLPTIKLDPRLISQVIMNLLTNAIKYTPPEGKIALTAKCEGEELVVCVIDNGYGIPESAKPKMFQKFFRADNVAKIETDGTGLGLYMVKAIVESSGGIIGFESQEDKGTTFTVKLPMSGMKAHEGEVTIDG